jgi:predicted phage terminase large subunit-like protein
MRPHAQTAVFENGFVLLPRTALWLMDCVDDLTGFPGAKHDDQVDPTTQAVPFLRMSPDLEIWARL